jgi:hypothetical protein
MTVADGSQTRLADISEVTIGTTPATPTFQVMRYVSADVRLAKQTDIPNEIRADRNVASIVDVGRMVQGSINTLLSYGTYDKWLERLFCGTWDDDVLVNGVLAKAATLEMTYEQGATDSYLRYTGCRWNTLALQMTARQSVTANWGIMGITSPTPTTAIIAGATYTAATTTEVFNAGLNVGALVMSSAAITSAPKMQSLSLNITNNIFPVDVVGQYETYAHGLGRFELTGTARVVFENLAVYSAILSHEDVALSFTLTDRAGNSYAVSIPKVKLLDGGPTVGGNGQAVIIEVPIQAIFDATAGGSIKITRTAA